jgi:predicted amidohydrolase YtcJ
MPAPVIAAAAAFAPRRAMATIRPGLRRRGQPTATLLAIVLLGSGATLPGPAALALPGSRGTASAAPPASGAAAPAPAPATLYSGGPILTMAGPTPRYAEALVEQGGRIVYVGPLAGAIRAAGSGARRLNLAGHALLPGFIDAHGHLPDYVATWGRPDLSPPPVGRIRSIADIQATVRDWLAKHPAPAGQLQFFLGYDDSLLAEKRHPTRADLDAVSATVPILLMHASGHLVVANSPALALVKIGQASPDPAGGHIQRDPATGEPNGVLEETAGLPFMALIPQPDQTEKLRRLDQVQKWWASYGITTAQDGLSNPDNLALLREAGRQGRLILDVVSYPFYRVLGDLTSLDQRAKGVEITTPGNDPRAAGAAAAAPISSMVSNAGREFASGGSATTAPPGDGTGAAERLKVGSYTNHLKIGGIKLTGDGSPQGKTAYMSQPYSSPPPGQKADYRAYAVMTQQELNDWVAFGYRHNIQIITHTNGDAALDQLLVAVQQARASYGAKDLRPVAIHAQLARHDQVDRIKALGIVPSFFTAHTFFWGDWHRQSFGEARAAGISPTGYASRQGVIFTNHNDAPVVPPDMLRLAQTAVQRTTRSGFVLGPAERLSPYEALRAMTAWAAYQYFEEKSKGTLEAGKLADLVILERDPLRVPPETIGAIPVLATIKEGRPIYRRGIDRLDGAAVRAASRVAPNPLLADGVHHH